MDARCAPAVLCHSPYEATNLRIHPRPPRALFLLGDLHPVASESISFLGIDFEGAFSFDLLVGAVILVKRREV